MNNVAESSAGFTVSSPWRLKFLGLCGVLGLFLLELGSVGLIYFIFTEAFNYIIHYCRSSQGCLIVVPVILLVLALPFIMIILADRMVMLVRYHIGRTAAVDGDKLTSKGKSRNLSSIAKVLKSSSLGRIKFAALDKSGKPVCYWLDNYKNAEQLLNWLSQGGCGVENIDSIKYIPNIIPQRRYFLYTDKDSLGNEISCFEVCSPWPQRWFGVFRLFLFSAVLLCLLYFSYYLIVEKADINFFALPFMFFISLMLSDFSIRMYWFKKGKTIVVKGDCLKVGGRSWHRADLIKCVETVGYDGTNFNRYMTNEFTVYDKSGKPIAYFDVNYHNAFELQRWLEEGGCKTVFRSTCDFLYYLRSLLLKFVVREK